MPATETLKNNVIAIEAASQRLSESGEDQQMSRALQPYRSRSGREHCQTALRLQSGRKALRPWPGHSQETKALPDQQRGISVRTQHNTLDLGSIRDRVKKKRALTIVNMADSSLQPRPADAEWQPLKPFEPSTRALVRGAIAANTRVNEPQTQAVGNLSQKELVTLPPGDKRNEIALTRGVGRVIAPREEEIDKLPMVEALPVIPDAVVTSMMTVDTNSVAIHQSMKGLQPLSEKAIAKQSESLPIDLPDQQAGKAPMQVTRYVPPSGAPTRPDEIALVRKVSSFLPGKTGSGRLLPGESQSHKVIMTVDTNGEALELGQRIKRRNRISRAEDIILAAIRSKADIDGKNAKVAYDVIAAMTGFSRRHVIRAVKSLIFERGKLRVDKRVLRPGHNAINVYDVVKRDATATENGHLSADRQD